MATEVGNNAVSAGKFFLEGSEAGYIASAVRAADCRSTGPWFESGCALFAQKRGRSAHGVRILKPAGARERSGPQRVETD